MAYYDWAAWTDAKKNERKRRTETVPGTLKTYTRPNDDDGTICTEVSSFLPHSIIPFPSLPSEKDVSDPCWIRKPFLTLSFVLRPNDSYFECPNGHWIPNSSVYFLAVDLDKIYSAHVPSRDTKHRKGSDRKKSFIRTLVSGWENILRRRECINRSL